MLLDKRGLFTDAEVATLKAFGELRQNSYSNNLNKGATAVASSSLLDHSVSAALDSDYETFWEAAPRENMSTPITLEITLHCEVAFKRIVLQKQI